MILAQPRQYRASGPTQGLSRMTLANITRGKLDKPLRVILYGVEGVGKSTFASHSPAPIFLCVEDGTSQLDIARFPSPRSWPEVEEAIRVLTHEEHTYKTLVVDTLDWLEPLLWSHVCQVAGKAGIEDFGYGKGYVAALDLWRALLARLDHLVRTRKVNVVLLAHAAIRRVDDPQTGPYDRYRMKLHDKAADLVREWVDAILFARHEVVTVERKGRTRGVSSGARVIHTTWTAAYDAKNRFDLPDTLPLDWEEFASQAKRATYDTSEADELREELIRSAPQLGDEATVAKLVEWANKTKDVANLRRALDKLTGKMMLAQGAPKEADGGGFDSRPGHL
jgi:hypothetical protein